MFSLTFSFSPPFVEGGGVVCERSVFLTQRTKVELRILRKTGKSLGYRGPADSNVSNQPLPFR